VLEPYAVKVASTVALDENTVTGRAFLQLAAAVVRQVDRRNMEMAPTRIVEVHK
jgi:ATP-binding protein involved in chromosome partitioning